MIHLRNVAYPNRIAWEFKQACFKDVEIASRGALFMISSVNNTMSETIVSSSVAQRRIIKLLTVENAKPTEILHTLRLQFGDETLTRSQVLARNKSSSSGRRYVQNTSYSQRLRQV